MFVLLAVITSAVDCTERLSFEVKSNQIKFIFDTKQSINEHDIIIRQMCRQDTKAVPTALTGALVMC